MRIRILLTLLVFAVLLGVGVSIALAAPRGICVSQDSGNWSSTSTWNCFGATAPPNSPSTDVFIQSAHTITVDGNYTAGNVTVEGTLNGGSSVTLTATSLTMNSSGTVNGQSGTIILGGNLTNNGTFNADSGTVVMNGTSAQSISGNLTFNNLTINNSSTTGVTLNSNAAVNGTLTLTTDLTTASGVVLTMGSSATTSGDADVVGKVKRTSLSTGTAYTFGSAYTTIEFTGGTSLPSDITVELFKAAPGGLGSPVTRYYSITSTSDGTNYTYNLRLHYRDSEWSGNSVEANLQIWRQDNSSDPEPGRWKLRARTGNDTNQNWVEKTGMLNTPNNSLLTLWALDDSGAPTAVNLSTFDARADTPNALLFVGLGALVVLALGVWWNRR